MNNTKFALVLRQCRENAKLTQKQVADALGIERSTYAYYETGLTQPKGKMIINLANVFGIEYDTFMDAISDFEFDRSADAAGFTTVTDSSWQDREKMHALSKNEQNLLLRFRTLSSEQRKYIVEEMERLWSESREKEKKKKNKTVF